MFWLGGNIFGIDDKIPRKNRMFLIAIMHIFRLLKQKYHIKGIFPPRRIEFHIAIIDKNFKNCSLYLKKNQVLKSDLTSLLLEHYETKMTKFFKLDLISSHFRMLWI